MTDKFYSIKEVCEILGVTRSTVYVYFKKGELPYLQIGGRRRVTPEALDRFIYGDVKKS